MNSCSLRQFDLYSGAIHRLQECKNATISVPELSQLLGVKTTTLNARLRRQRIPVQTVGRTNLIPGSLALRLAEIHKHALIGWPTLQEASKIIGIKAGTIKAWCEKGQLDSSLDLTKRLRVNPDELTKLQSRSRPTLAHEPERRFNPETVTVTASTRAERNLSAPRSDSKINGKARSKSICSTASGDSTVEHGNANRLNSATPLRGTELRQIRPTPPARPIPPIPQVRVISARDYGLPETECTNHPRSAPENTILPRHSGPAGLLVYDPEDPFSISQCATGKVVRHDGYDGKIVEVLDDPFNPKIKVKFPEHKHPLLMEVLLIVGKRRPRRVS